jgi:hypothetical protein
MLKHLVDDQAIHIRPKFQIEARLILGRFLEEKD